MDSIYVSNNHSCYKLFITYKNIAVSVDQGAIFQYPNLMFDMKISNYVPDEVPNTKAYLGYNVIYNVEVDADHFRTVTYIKFMKIQEALASMGGIFSLFRLGITLILAFINKINFGFNIFREVYLNSHSEVSIEPTEENINNPFIPPLPKEQTFHKDIFGNMQMRTVKYNNRQIYFDTINKKRDSSVKAKENLDSIIKTSVKDTANTRKSALYQANSIERFEEKFTLDSVNHEKISEFKKRFFGSKLNFNHQSSSLKDFFDDNADSKSCRKTMFLQNLKKLNKNSYLQKDMTETSALNINSKNNILMRTNEDHILHINSINRKKFGNSNTLEQNNINYYKKILKKPSENQIITTNISNIIINDREAQSNSQNLENPKKELKLNLYFCKWLFALFCRKKRLNTPYRIILNKIEKELEVNSFIRLKEEIHIMKELLFEEEHFDVFDIHFDFKEIYNTLKDKGNNHGLDNYIKKSFGEKRPEAENSHKRPDLTQLGKIFIKSKTKYEA